MVKISDAVKSGIKILGVFDNARLEAEVLLKDVMICDSLYLHIHSNDNISDDCFEKFISYCKRRAAGEPSAYITGKKEFMSLEFDVDKNVLIPRPETELLVEKIIEKYKDCHVDILDICTGSGAIACSLAKYMPNAKVTATDICSESIDVAKKNACKFNIEKQLDFIVSDALADSYNFSKKYDVVVSNPPYIETAVIDSLERTVKDYEPLLALDGGADGLEFYRKISRNIKPFLNKGAMIIFEIGYNQGRDVGKILNEDCWTGIKVIKDYSLNDRIVLAYDDQLSK